jgi:hypothetical protein
MEPYPDIYIVAIKPNGDIIPLRIINTTLINPGNGAPSFEFVDDLTIGSHTYNNKSVTLSSTLLSIEQDKIGIAVKFNGGPFQLQNVNITNFQLSTTTPNAQPNTPDNVFYEPDFTEDFTNNDYNALLGNAFIARDSQYFMDVDYSTSPVVGSSLTPINFDQLIAGTATRAQVQDYYYNLRRHIIPRYLGSKSTAPSFNTFSTNLENKGFGKDIVAGNPKPFVGYYSAKGGSTPEVIGKTIINLDYIIDEEIQTQVPALSDFTYDNQIQLFERGTYLYLDPDKNSAQSQFAGNNKYKIYRSGEYATPILYSQTGSIPGFLPSLTFNEPGAPIIDNQFKSSLPALSTTLNEIFSGSMQNIPEFSLNFISNNIPLNWGDTQLYPFFPLAADKVGFSLGTVTDPNTGNEINYRAFKINGNGDPGISASSKVSLKLKTNPNIGQDLQNGKLIISIIKKTDLTPFTWTEFQEPNNILSSTFIDNIFITANEDEYEIELESNSFVPFTDLKQLAIIANFECTTAGVPTIYPSEEPYFIVQEGSFSLIQSPEPNQVTIPYAPGSGQYITGILDEGVAITSNFDFYSGNVPCALISLNLSFISALGKIYPQIPGSGYDATIYPFEISPNSIFETTTTPEYEIRFNADENLVFPIIGSYAGFFDGEEKFWLIVGRPEGYSLQDNIIGDARQSFLIRRWIPRAGYIYLDIDASLGVGIVKPEYITDGIKNKIPQIVKELTDKGLI